MERPNKLNAATLAFLISGAAVGFVVGWVVAAPTSEVLVTPERPAANRISSPISSANSRQQDVRLLSAGSGTFSDLLKMETAAARMRPADWPALWRRLMRTKQHYGLFHLWPEADPQGALKAALDAADDDSLADQERYDFQFLGGNAINELFRSDVPAALQAIKDWRGKYGERPRLNCLHLLVTGNVEQKAALLDLLRKEGADGVDLRGIADLRALDALQEAGVSARDNLHGDVMQKVAAIRPTEAVDWLLSHSTQSGVSLTLLSAAMTGLTMSDVLDPARERAEAMGRLLAVAPPDMVDKWAEAYATRRAEFDPEGALLWANEHVPEGRLRQVQESLSRTAR